MPYTFKSSRDGLTIKNLPDSIDPKSPELGQIIDQLRAQGVLEHDYASAEGLSSLKMIPSHSSAQAEPVAAPVEEAPGLISQAIKPWQQFAQGVASTSDEWIGKPLVAAAQKLGIISPETAEGQQAGFDARSQQIAQEEEQGGLAAQIPTMLGKAAPGVALNTIGGVGIGSALARSSRPVVAGVGRMLAANPAQQVAGAVAGEVGTRTAEKLGAPAPVQFAAGVASGLLGAHTAAPSKVVVPASAMGPGAESAEKAGIRVMTSDVKPPTTFAGKWLQGAGEKIPFIGTAGARKAQQSQRIDAVKDLLVEYGAADAAQASDEVTKSLLAKRWADRRTLSTMKGNVIEKLSGAGPVPVDNATVAIDQQISKLKGMNSKEALPVIDRLEDWKNALVGYKDGVVQGQSLDNIELLRKQIGESFKSQEVAGSRKLGEDVLSRIYGPLRKDMGDFIKQNGGSADYTKWAVANKRLSEIAEEGKISVLSNVLKKGKDTPEVIQKILFSAKPSEVKLLVKNLPDSGLQKAKTAVLAKAAEDAGGLDNIDPDRFARSVKKLGSNIGIIFDPIESDRVMGLGKALELTQRATKGSAAPPTGVHAFPFLFADALLKTFGGPMVATGAAAAIGGSARAYESAAVRNLLVRLGRASAGSPEEAQIYAQIFKRVSPAVQATIEPKEEQK